MSTTDIKRTLCSCAAEARKAEPTNIDQRARAFVALLSGAIGANDEQLGDLIYSIVLRNEGDPA